MTTTNFCRRMSKEQRIAIDRWARRLDAEDVTIHTDGSVTLLCEDGYICHNYTPSARELAGKGGVVWQY